jgi:hypothetical protein
LVAVALPSEMEICTPERMSNMLSVTTEALLCMAPPTRAPTLPNRPPTPAASWPVASLSMMIDGSM